MNSELTLSNTEQKEPYSILKVDFQKAAVLFLRIALVVEGLGAGSSMFYGIPNFVVFKNTTSKYFSFSKVFGKHLFSSENL